VPAALALLDRGETFDVMLCDLMMPGMSGADFHDEVERRWPALLGRILVVTGGAVTPRSQALLQRAVNRPLEKPFFATVLEARIAELLR
jgi:CheY-like chemotaxis protein